MNTVDDAQRRRMNMAPFIHKPEKPDPNLAESLKAEWPGILRWMMNGCLDWQANRLVRPSSVLEATKDYFANQDVLGQWLEDECDAERGNRYKTALNSELFASWKSYAERAEEPPGTHKAFTMSMKKRGFRNRKAPGGVREWLGVRLKPRPQHDEP